RRPAAAGAGAHGHRDRLCDDRADAGDRAAHASRNRLRPCRRRRLERRMNGSHLIVAPVVIPLLAGAALLLLERRGERTPGGAASRLPAGLSLAAVLLQLLIALVLVAHAAGGDVSSYLLGNWQAPFGIALA